MVGVRYLFGHRAMGGRTKIPATVMATLTVYILCLSAQLLSVETFPGTVKLVPLHSLPHTVVVKMGNVK